jgi:hypothetical protein
MVRPAAALFVVMVMAGGAPVGHAQEAQPSASAAQPAEPAAPLLEKIKIDRAGGIHVTKLFAIVFGGIKGGSSMAAGPALSHDFDDGSFVQLKGVYSIRQFKLLQARYDSRPILSRRAMVSTRVRWQDAPELSLYALGPHSPDGRAEYGERRMEWSGFLRAGIAPHANVTVGSGLERYALDAGFIDNGEDERLGVVPDVPGLATHPWFVHSFAGASFDTRFSPDYSRTGTVLDAGTHGYHDMHDGRGSFHGFEIGAEHLIPTIRTVEGGPTGWKGALDLSARAWLTESGDGSTVPFYLMPTLGGGDFLRGYPLYRFRDRNAVVLIGEYRWAVHPMIDVAARYEAGGVAPTLHQLSASGLAQSAGGGLRVHSKTAGLLRIDLAVGQEGVQFSIGFNVTGG